MENITTKIYNELFEGWTRFEAFWLFLFLAAQTYFYIQSPDTILGVIAGISGIITVVFVSKGKISNYFFGLIFAYSYFYVSWDQKFYGEMTTTLFVYIPAQFIGYFLWREHMRHGKKAESVIAKSLTVKDWLFTTIAVVVGSILFITFLKTTDANSASLDGVTTILVVAAQILMLLRYREQWLFWIVINVLSIILWANSPSMYVMYSAYLLNSLYGFYNWTKLGKQLEAQ